MSNGRLVRLVPLTGAMVGVPYPGYDAAFPPSNLADPQPKVVFKSTVPGGANQLFIDIDLGADVPIDTVALLFTNMTAGANWWVQGASHAAGAGGLAYILGFTGPTAFGVAATTKRNPRHAIALGGVSTVGYLRIGIFETAAFVMQAGIVCVGQSWVCTLPYANFELGSGRKVNDLSIRHEMDGGELGFLKKAKVAEFRATWSSMTDADLRALWSILLEVGESEPLLMIEDPDAVTGQLEGIHYCIATGLDFYERQQVDKTRIELRFREWM